MVPSKGLEPPHPCEYMDLNHARLPIPPRWQMNLLSSSDPSSPCQEDLHFYSTDETPPVKPPAPRFLHEPEPALSEVDRVPFAVDAFAIRRTPEVRSPPYSSFAVIVIFAFSTFDTGHPFSAASAYF
jgi:hypothetical protein